MILEPKHKNFKDDNKIKERVKKKFNIRRHMSISVALEWHYFQKLLNWWHSPFKVKLKNLVNLKNEKMKQFKKSFIQIPLILFI